MDAEDAHSRPIKTFTGEDVPKEQQWTEETCKLLKDITVTSMAVHSTVKDLLGKINSSALDTEQGHSFLQLRNVLMTEYLLNLSQVIATKVSGHSLVDSPAIERAVQVRTYLEKMRPIQMKLKYQIDKAVRAASAQSSRVAKSGPQVDDVLSLRPKLEDIQIDDDDEGGNSDGEVSEDTRNKEKKYVAPKVASVPYDEDETGEEKKAKRLERARRRALNSNLMKELMEELDEVPEEIQESTLGRRKADRAAAEMTRYEEEYFTRLTNNKEKKRKKQQGALMTVGDLGSAVTQFDDVSALDRGAVDEDEDDKSRRSKRRKTLKSKASAKKGRKIIPKRVLMRHRTLARRK